MSGNAVSPSFSFKQQSSSAMKATQRSHRGFSRKVQSMVKQLERERSGELVTAGMGGVGKGGREGYEQRNWRQLTDRDLARLGTVARSRYLAYEPVPKGMHERQQESLRRVRERRTKQKKDQQELTLSQLVELERNSELVGQIKAAEARHRVKALRERYEREQNQELSHLISNQPTSVDSIRLKTFLKTHPASHASPIPNTPTDPLSKTQRKRCEILIEDDTGLTTNRLK